MANENNMEQLQYLHGMYMQEYNAILQSINTYRLSMDSVRRTLYILEHPEDIREKNLLFGIEAGTFIEVKAGDVEKVVTDIGAGYLVEKTPKDAHAFLASNLEHQEEFSKKLQEQKITIESELFKLEYQLNGMGN